MSFIFYDTETTGINTTYDQILQFAAILTDDELTTLDTFSIRCRLLPYVVPSPGALLVTGVSIGEITTCPTSHYQMMCEVCRKMEAWSEGGAIFAGWNSLRFDETLLRQAYYQNLLPIYQTNTNGNGRADIMRLTQIVAACAPGTLVVPIQDDGKASFRLGPLAEANGIHMESAHEALADSEATLEVARLIRRRVPLLWEVVMGNARKSGPQSLFRQQHPILLSETYFGTSHNFSVVPIAAGIHNANEWAMFDLAHEPERFLEADDETLQVAIEGKTKVIRRVSINAFPGLLPIDHLPADVRGGRHPLEVYQSRARLVCEHSEFRQRVARLMAGRYEGQVPSEQIEERIYAGFPPRQDEILMKRFHESAWEDRPALLRSFSDDRYRQLAQRLLACERPDLLEASQADRWADWLQTRVLTAEDVPWMTVTKALSEIEDLRTLSSVSAREPLDELEQFLLSRHECLGRSRPPSHSYRD
jgi:exodeoxyribonuclease-1